MLYLSGVCCSACDASGGPHLAIGAGDQGSCGHAPVLCAQGHALGRQQGLCEGHVHHTGYFFSVCGNELSVHEV